MKKKRGSTTTTALEDIQALIDAFHRKLKCGSASHYYGMTVLERAVDACSYEMLKAYIFAVYAKATLSVTPGDAPEALDPEED